MCIYPRGYRLGTGWGFKFQVDVGAFIGWSAGGEAHDLRNARSLHMIGIIVAQRLGFDVVDYPEQK